MIPALTTSVLLLAAVFALLRLQRVRFEFSVRNVFNALLVPNLDDERFKPSELAVLPAPAARYLRHAIRPGSRICLTADLRLSGRVRTAPQGDWLAFEACERVCAGRGFVSRSRVERADGQALEGVESLFDGKARSDFFLGSLPVVRRRGDRLTRSALGRLLIQSLWVPACLLPSRGARWRPGDQGFASVRIDDRQESSALNVFVAADGAPSRVSMLVYRDGPVGHSGLTPLGLRVEGELTFDGYTVPARVVATWNYGTDDAFDFLFLELESGRFH
jgi:hypothetical protein